MNDAKNQVEEMSESRKENRIFKSILRLEKSLWLKGGLQGIVVDKSVIVNGKIITYKSLK